ncbi:MAG: hypothetical protein R2742_06710 [Micropruina glycogenica]
MREQFTVVALPYSCSPDADYHVSLFVSPDIEVDDPRDTLAVTELFQHWTRALAEAKFVLEDDQGELPCEPLLGAVEDGLWEEVFPPETPVTSYTPPEWTQRPWRTFHPGTTTTIAKLVNLMATMVNGVDAPTVQQLPWYGTGLFETLSGRGNRHQFNPLELVGRLETEQTRLLDEATREKVPLGEFPTPRRYFENGSLPDGLPGGPELGAAMVELHRAGASTATPRKRPTTSRVPTPTTPAHPRPTSRFPTSTRASRWSTTTARCSASSAW